MSIREQYTVPKRFNSFSIALMVLGVIAIIALYISTHGGGITDEHTKNQQDARFWGSLLQNSVYFLLVVNAAMFFICATTLAWGGWQMVFRRVSEAISACVPIVGVLAGIILISICLSDNHTIYHWTDAEHVKHDPVLDHKKGFLSKGFFITMTIITIVGWSWLGWKMRQLSRSIDNKPLNLEDGKK